MVGDFDANLVIAPVQNIIYGSIRDGILIAELVADVLKRLVEIIDVIGKKRAAAGLFRKVLKNLVAFGEMVFAVGGLVGIGLRQGDPLRAGADAVNDDAGALGQFDGFRARVGGQVVLAITDENHDAADHVGLVTRRPRGMVQLRGASFVDGVVDSRAAAGARAGDLVAQRASIAGEGLRICGSSSKVMTKA